MQEIVDFPISSLGIYDILKGIDDLFDGNNAIGLLMFRFKDDAVSALPYFLHDLIFLVNVVIAEGTTVFELLACKYQTLLM